MVTDYKIKNIADFNNKLVLKNQYSIIKEKIRIDKSFLNTQKISFRQKKRNIIQFNMIMKMIIANLSFQSKVQNYQILI